MPRFSLLSDWLVWLESLHPKAIDLGLSRVYRVAARLGILLPFQACSHDYSGPVAIPGCQVVTVAGTNGKGSCVKTLEECLLSRGHSVGTYTSPHLHHYCERIHINGSPVAESLVCEAFSAIDDARGDISLTYFEFGTLAALWLFTQDKLPFILLEVGLGGRLDAVNIVDADIAVVTSIAVDHEDWLGSDRDVIAVEKLGITRKNCPVVIAEDDMTRSMQAFMDEHSCVYSIGHEFYASRSESVDNTRSQLKWMSFCDQRPVSSLTLPLPELPLPSVAAALQVLDLLNCLPSEHELVPIFESLTLVGRYQQCFIAGNHIIFDVAHNAAAARGLADRLTLDTQHEGRVLAVFAMMADKDLPAIIGELKDIVDVWYVGELEVSRAAPSSDVAAALIKQEQSLESADCLVDAFDIAAIHAAEHDRIVVFGSFFTVAAIQNYLEM